MVLAPNEAMPCPFPVVEHIYGYLWPDNRNMDRTFSAKPTRPICVFKRSNCL